jgi:hypothetical protein
VTVWFGELQWRLAHGYEFKTNPVLDTLEHIECRDALLVNIFTPPPRTNPVHRTQCQRQHGRAPMWSLATHRFWATAK